MPDQMLKYIIVAATYRGHTLMIAPRPGAEPAPQVVNQRLDPGYERAPDGKETGNRIMYVQCGRPDCQCATPLVSQALQPADEFTSAAVKKQKETTDAQRRAAHAGTDRDSLRASFAELALENEKLKRAAAEAELENIKLKLAAAENAKPRR